MNIWHDMHPDLIRKEEYTVFTANSMGSTAVLAFDGSTGLLPWDRLLCLTQDDTLHLLMDAWGLSSHK